MSGLVLVLSNLKPKKLAGSILFKNLGFNSNGMVLCASNEDHTKVELLRPKPGISTAEIKLFLGT